MGAGTGYGALAAVGLGPDRSLSNGLAGFGVSSSSSSSPPTTSAGSVAGMLGLGRAPTVYQHQQHSHHSTPPPHHHTHSPSHHPHYQSAEAQEQQRKLIDLEFQYHYVVDQLVYYSTIKTGENFFQLASLLFCTLLGNRIFQIWSPAYLRDPRVAVHGGTGTSSSSSSAAANGTGATNSSGTAHAGGNGSSVSGANGGGGGGIEDESMESRVLQTGANGFTMVHIHNNNNSAQGGRQNENGEEPIRVWPESLRKWVEALDYFVSFFPYHTRQLETLKTLHHSLISS